MTFSHIGNGVYTCLSGDTKTTTGITTNSVLVETNTGTIYTFTSGAWNSVGGGGAGEANLAANVGTGAGTIFRDKTSVTLNLKTIKAGTGVTITNNTNDITLDATGAGGGETNTASNFGSSGTGIWKDKNGVDLRFYKINSTTNRLGIALSGTDHVDLTVNEANLAVAYSQLTSVPTTIVKTDQANTFGAALDQIVPSGSMKLGNSGFNAGLSVGTLAGNITITLPNTTSTLVTSTDSRLSDTRTPTAHASTHNSAGGDAVHIDTIGAGTDITTNNASTTKHGLLKKLSNAATDYMDGTGNWSVPPTGSGGETNTMSNLTGTAGAVGVYKQKTGVNFEMKKINAGSTKVTITDDTTNNEVDIDVAQANLSIAYSQLTSVPSTFAPTAHKSAHVSGGGDAFVKADVLVAASRYIETRTDPASDAQAIWINATSSELEYWDTQAAPVKQTIATIGSTQTFTGKTMSGASNTFSNIAYSSLTSVPTTIVKTDQTNTFGAFAQIFPSTQLKLLSNGFNYIFTGTTIAADRTVNLPLMTGTDTLAVLDLAQTFTTKTINATNNTITDTSTAAGDLLKSNGTKFVRMARGTGLQVLRTNSGATDLEFASLNSENAGTALASGNGSTTTFNVAHGLGSTPYQAMILCSTHTNVFTYTYDATNIIVVFTTAPPSGTNNVKFQFRATL